jgi:hypothetical protein
MKSNNFWVARQMVIYGGDEHYTREGIDVVGIQF